MSTSEPFLPVKHARSDDIDAADPGLGAPGTVAPVDIPERDIEAQEQAFAQRMERERGTEPLFRTPDPDDVRGGEPAADA